MVTGLPIAALVVGWVAARASVGTSESGALNVGGALNAGATGWFELQAVDTIADARIRGIWRMKEKDMAPILLLDFHMPIGETRM
jgi:hypothetical protein